MKTVYKNAKVLSIEMDDSETRAEAIVIEEDKIKFIGSNKEADKYIDSLTKVIDCKGGSLLPGFTINYFWMKKGILLFGAKKDINA